MNDPQYFTEAEQQTAEPTAREEKLLARIAEQAKEIEKLALALYQIARSPYPLHDHCSRETWEFVCNLVAYIDALEAE
jgi:hypothetical protein